MKLILPDLICHEQTGFLKGRYIGENTTLILDLVNYYDNQSIPGALLFLDFEKAFDYLDWEFMHNTLSYFKFGPEFKRWIATLYSNISSCVLNNGLPTTFVF